MKAMRMLTIVLYVSCLAAASAVADLQDGLVAYYPLDGDLLDASGNGHDAVPAIGDAAMFVQGFMNEAVDTREAGVDCGTWDPSDEQTDAVSGSCWAYWFGLEGAAAQWQGILAKRSGWGTGVTRWHLESWDGQATVGLSNHTSDGGGGAGSFTLIQDEWQHIAFTFDGTEAAIYHNGERTGGGAWKLGPDTDAHLTIGIVQAPNGNRFNGYIDEVGFWNRGLTEDEVAEIYNEGAGLSLTGPALTAGAPNPADESQDVPQDTDLGWKPSAFAHAHNVYFGTSYDDVNAATVDAPLDVLASAGQDANSFDPEGVLDFGQTYYWRIDEVNAPPDRTVFKGDIWGFTVEPFAYPVENIIATSNGTSDATAIPQNTVNGSGLHLDGTHSIAADDMWLATPGVDPLYIQFEFDRLYVLHEMLVWNYNVQFELVLGFGVKDVTAEYSANGIDWITLGDFGFAQATARADYAANTKVAFAGVAARFVRLNVTGGHGPMGQFGLSEVTFSFKPVVARQPSPADGQTDVGLDLNLDWRAGREAVVHDVHLSADRDAIEAGTALVDSVSESNYAVSALDLGTTYFWKIDEVNEAATTWTGDVWSFSTLEFFTIEDFESYDDEENRIFDIWIDGFVNNTGSTVGYFEAPFAERSIVNRGAQSMPLEYNNADAPFYSEAERDLDSVDFTASGADTLVVNYRGNPASFVERADGSILIGAGGADIWGTADQFRFVYKRLDGDGSIVARVDSIERSDAWAKAGVMIRESLDPSSTHAMVVITPDNGVSFQRRTITASNSASTDTAGLVAPYWLKLTRTGRTFTAQHSADGITWIDLADAEPLEIAMLGTVYIGLAVTSHNTSQMTTAEFSNVSTSGGVTGSWQAEAIGLEQPANDPAPLYVAVEDGAGRVAIVTHPNSEAALATQWQAWQIPFDHFTGISLDDVNFLYLGVGDRDNPTAGGAGLLYIDDILVGHPLAVE